MAYVVAASQKYYDVGIQRYYVAFQPFEHMVGGIARNAAVIYVEFGIMLRKVVHLRQRIAEKYHAAALGVLAQPRVYLRLVLFYGPGGDKRPPVYPVDDPESGYCENEYHGDAYQGFYAPVVQLPAFFHTLITREKYMAYFVVIFRVPLL